MIELLDGRQPYHQLQPMPALFRIVNDDHPPLPQGASPVVIDFLMQCFQKDPNLRVSARKLLKHPWIVSARRSDAVVSKKATEYTEAVKSVQEWNEALKDSPNGSGDRKNSHPLSDSPIPPRESRTRTLGKPTVPVQRKDAPSKFRSPEGTADDNWDDDFDTAISPTALQLPHLRPHDNFGGALSSERLKAYASIGNMLSKENEPDSRNITVRGPLPEADTDNSSTVRATPVLPKKPERGHARHKSEMPKPQTKPSQTPRKASLPSSRQNGNISKTKTPASKPPAEPKSTRLFRESSIEDFSDIIEGNELALDTKLGMMKLENEAKILDSPSVTDLMQSMKPPTAGGSWRRPPAPRAR